MQITIDPIGFIEYLGRKYPCALGKGGLQCDKREGDGATPVGTFTMGRIFYRADRTARPISGLPCHPISPDMGWCDDPDHPDYNRLITLPHPARHEKLWRDDHVYVVVVELSSNTGPVIAGRGSAIFIHVAKPGYTPTEGCVALKYEDLLELLQMCNEGDYVTIPAPHSP